MINILLFIGAIGFISWQLAVFFNDVWLRDAQQKQLRQKFEDWWLTVADLDKLKLALACTIKLNSILDKTFGVRLFSKRAFWRSSMAATGLLVASLGLIGLFNHQTFGVQPWKNYRDTAVLVEKFLPEFESRFRMPSNPTSLTNKQPTTTIIAPLSTTNATNFSLTNKLNSSTTDTNLAEFIASLEKLNQTTKKYDTTTLSIVYSVSFLIVLILLNALLCFFALVLSRLILREMIAAARPFSTVALLVTNFFLVINVASFFLLLLTVLATPLVWFFLPFIFGLSEQSFTVFLFLLLGGEIASWIFSSAALKLVTLIAFLPCIFALGVSVFSGAAMIWRNLFHKCVSAILLRCAERGPLTVIIAVSALTASLIAVLGKLIHWTH